MFKLFFENEQNIQEKISKISDKEFTSSYQAFNDELIKFVLFNVDKCMKENNKELYLSFINKFISIIELNHKINSNKEDYELIYYSLSKHIFTNNDYVYMLFFKCFEYMIEDLNQNLKINDILLPLSTLLNRLQPYSKDKSGLKTVYTTFLESFIPRIVKVVFAQFNLTKEKPTIISFLNFFLQYYTLIIRELFVSYCKDYLLISKETLFINSIINEITKLISFNNTIQKDDISLLVFLLSNSKTLSILQMMSIFLLNKPIFCYFIHVLLKAIPEYLCSSLQNSSNSLDKFLKMKNIEEYFFNIHNRNFFFNDIKEIPNIIEEFHKIVYDILTKENGANIYESFVKALDIVIRQDNDNDSLESIIFSYFDIIPQYETFEWIYIHSIINRGVDECFDYIKEKKIIEKIEECSRDKCAYSYRLQTLINNIKISRNEKMNVIVLPFHSYHLFNQNCKPNINKQLMDKFQKFIDESKFPKNSHLIYQQGFIEFTSRKKVLKDITIKSDVIQYTILTYIGEKKAKFIDIKNEINLNDEMLRFLLSEMEKQKIVSCDENGDVYWLNESTGNGNKGKTIDIRVNYELFFEGGGDYSTYHRKMTEKYQGMLWDCYIVKYLKQKQSTKKTSTIEDILKFLNESLPSNSKSYLSLESLSKNMTRLVTKGFISNPSPSNYKYI